MRDRAPADIAAVTGLPTPADDELSAEIDRLQAELASSAAEMTALSEEIGRLHAEGALREHIHAMTDRLLRISWHVNHVRTRLVSLDSARRSPPD